MGKPLSDKERQLQRKLIPLNIFVCILCLIAMLSLFFTPFIKADAGKMLRSEQAKQMVNDMVDVQAEGADYSPLVEIVVENVLGSAEGSVSFTASGAMKVFFAPAEQRTGAALELLLTGDGALVDTLIDSIVAGVDGMFESEEDKRAIEEVMVSSLVYSAADGIGEISVEKAAALADIFSGVNDITDGNTASVAQAVIAELEKDVALTDAEKAGISLQIQQLYDDAQSCLGAGERVTFEAIVCVTVSKTVDLSSLNVANILENLIGSGGAEGASLARSGGKIVTSYPELAAELGIDESNADRIKADLKDLLAQSVGTGNSIVAVVFKNYGWLFIGIAAFMLPWLVLFLFSFIRTFTKNKRFMMWYVKLTGFIPPLVFLALVLAPNVLTAFLPELPELISVLVSGLSSMTWICGVCYILLWLASILWAFPIKHKIRKERKFMKGLIKSGVSPEDLSATAVPAGDAPADNYGYGYGSDLYGSDYGSDLYGTDYGYGSDGLDGIDPYDPDGFDEIIDDYGLGSDFEFGSGYGSFGGFGSLDSYDSYDDDDEDDDY